MRQARQARQARPTPRPIDEKERALGRQARMAAFVIAGTMLLWIGVQWMGVKMDWDPRFVSLFDLAALAAFFWALVVAWRVWRRSREN